MKPSFLAAIDAPREDYDHLGRFNSNPKQVMLYQWKKVMQIKWL
jgi:hypothetical protein